MQFLVFRHTLAKELKISVITTKRAYEELEKEGFIETVIGKGSFVTSKNTETLIALIKEETLKSLEQCLYNAVDIAKNSNISSQELHDILNILYGDD